MLCSIGEYPKYLHLDKTSLENITTMIRRKIMFKFPDYFPISRLSIVQPNDIGELMYVLPRLLGVLEHPDVDAQARG